LLVYEPGQFFRIHQDSEKSDDMIGTLSVVLPSAYSGGAEVIEHRGEKLTFRRTAQSGKALTFIAFYADCQHEIRPIKSGYRVVLVYNLLVRPATKDVAEPIDSSAIDDLAATVTHHFDTAVQKYHWQEPAKPEKLVYLLDHDYTQSGIGWHRLKRADIRRVAGLRAAAMRLDCEILLGLVDIEETWDCFEESSSPNDYGCSRSIYDDPVGEDEGDEEQLEWHGNVARRTGRHPDLALNELIECGVDLHDLLDETGKPAGLSSLWVDTSELCFTRAHDDAEPLRSEYEPYMGNYGNTVERWYRRAAVVLWPRERAFTIRGRGDPVWAIGEIAKRLSAKAPENARELVRNLLPVWGRTTSAAKSKQLLSRTIKVAGQLAHPELAAGLLQPLSPAGFSRKAVSQLVDLNDTYGFAWSRALFEYWYERDRRYGFRDDPNGLEFLVEACAALHSSGGQAGRSLAIWLAGKEWALVEVAIEQQLQDPWRPNVRRHLSKLGPSVASVIRATAAAHATDQRTAIVRHLATQEPRAIMPLLVSALRACREQVAARGLRSLGLGVLVGHCTTALAAGEPAREPDDWSIDPPMICSCELCDTLGRFLADRQQKRLMWPLAKDGRRHVHGQIDCYELPVSHVTQRVGRPFTLVLAKQKALFTRASKRRAELVCDLAWLRRERRRFV
jgi:hypothetical protein